LDGLFAVLTIVSLNGSTLVLKAARNGLKAKKLPTVLKPTQVGGYKCTKVIKLITLKELGKLTS